MFSLSGLFVSAAQAADLPAAAVADVAAAVPPAPTSGDTLMRFAPLFLIFGVFYFVLIRPQQKQYDKTRDMQKALKKGDKIVTSGGMLAMIVKTDEDEHVTAEIAKGVEVKILREMITKRLGDEPAKPANANDKK